MDPWCAGAEGRGQTCIISIMIPNTLLRDSVTAFFRRAIFELIGEFDPGSGRTLAACLTHASHGGLVAIPGNRRTGAEHVSNLPISGG
jgi:hypothetical protein